MKRLSPLALVTAGIILAGGTSAQASYAWSVYLANTTQKDEIYCSLNVSVSVSDQSNGKKTDTVNCGSAVVSVKPNTKMVQIGTDITHCPEVKLEDVGPLATALGKAKGTICCTNSKSSKNCNYVSPIASNGDVIQFSNLKNVG